jgi:hypothetical protein
MLKTLNRVSIIINNNTMSTKKENLDLTPLKENEQGQIEGGFAEVAGGNAAEADGTNIWKCTENSVAGCGAPVTTKPA